MPFPVPLLPLVIVIQLVLLLAAVQAHPLVVVTVAVWAPPAATTFCAVGAIVKLHTPACVTFERLPGDRQRAGARASGRVGGDVVGDGAVPGPAAAARDRSSSSCCCSRRSRHTRSSS